MKNKKHIRDSSIASLIRNDEQFFEKKEKLFGGEAAEQLYTQLIVNCHSERSEESNQYRLLISHP